MNTTATSQERCDRLRKPAHYPVYAVVTPKDKTVVNFSEGSSRLASLINKIRRAGLQQPTWSETPDAAPRSPPLASRRRRERSRCRVDWTAAPALPEGAQEQRLTLPLRVADNPPDMPGFRAFQCTTLRVWPRTRGYWRGPARPAKMETARRSRGSA